MAVLKIFENYQLINQEGILFSQSYMQSQDMYYLFT